MHFRTANPAIDDRNAVALLDLILRLTVGPARIGRPFFLSLYCTVKLVFATETEPFVVVAVVALAPT